MKTRIITFCNRYYVHLAAVWAEHIGKLGIENYVVIAADAWAHEWLKRRGINTRLVEISRMDCASITGRYRMSILRQYLADGEDALLTDVDTIWRRNLLAEYEDCPDIDIFTAQTKNYQTKGSMRLRFAIYISCGLLYIRSSRKTLDFFDQYVQRLGDSKTDQHAFNVLLRRTRWVTASADLVYIRKKLGVRGHRCFRSDLVGYNRDFDLRLCLLSVLKVQRSYLDDSGSVYHYSIQADYRMKLFPLSPFILWPGDRLLAWWQWSAPFSYYSPGKAGRVPDKAGARDRVAPGAVRELAWSFRDRLQRSRPGCLMWEVFRGAWRAVCAVCRWFFCLAKIMRGVIANVRLMISTRSFRSIIPELVRGCALSFRPGDNLLIRQTNLPDPWRHQVDEAFQVTFRERVVELYQRARVSAPAAKILSEEEFISLFIFLYDERWRFRRARGLAVVPPEMQASLKKMRSKNARSPDTGGKSLRRRDIIQLLTAFFPPDDFERPGVAT